MSKMPVTLVYDGMCPMCTSYARATRIRKQFGGLELIDARSGAPLVKDLIKQGYDLNEGMVLLIEDKIYHGAQALEVVACISGRVGIFNRLNYMIFRHHSLATALYPLLRFGRNMLLRILGRSQIRQSKPL